MKVIYKLPYYRVIMVASVFIVQRRVVPFWPWWWEDFSCPFTDIGNAVDYAYVLNGDM